MACLIDSVIGHREIWQKLRQLAGEGRLPHAMAFCGPTGIGKKHIAWAIAQALLCESEQPPCGECSSCRRVEKQQSEGVLLIQPQSGMIKLEAAEQILQFLSLRQLGRARVIVVDDAQSLNPQAANALLKVVEEPPPQTFFIFLVPEISQLMPTLRSRLQVMRFMPLSERELQSAEGLPEWVVRSARGSFAHLETFREQSEEREAALAYLENAVRGQRSGLDTVLAQAKEREAALQILQFLQQLLRDWSMLEVQERMIHRDFLPRLQALPALPLVTRTRLWQEAFQLERDFVAHVDRNLLFETFFTHTVQLVKQA